MPVTCDAGHGCTITCPGTSCAAIYFHDTGKCVTWCCEDDITTTIERIGREVSELKCHRGSKVNFSASGGELIRTAAILNCFLPKQILCAAHKAYTRISQNLEEVSLEEVVKSLELSLVSDKGSS